MKNTDSEKCKKHHLCMNLLTLKIRTELIVSDGIEKDGSSCGATPYVGAGRSRAVKQSWLLLSAFLKLLTVKWLRLEFFDCSQRKTVYSGIFLKKRKLKKKGGEALRF